MSTDIHSKLDRLLAGQVAQAKATADLETSIAAVVQGISGLVPLLGAQTEMLRLLLAAATQETPGDSNLPELLTQILATMERMEAAIVRLPGAVEQMVRPTPSPDATPAFAPSPEREPSQGD
ncbi:hypothetical protein [Muricoccus pecuniae]|uniref:Uncharacterized protein n=1 Tax=Muricoccus pecuniae TaxID=693023 RepID=A0A840Y7B1_9PROT|nr:hypothetical protein [Roseomonas pecuniae]MBB5696046.1 hypothetical protein [Roseomonas pecuniae]